MEKTNDTEILELKEDDLTTITAGKMIVNQNMASLAKIDTGIKISKNKDSSEKKVGNYSDGKGGELNLEKKVEYEVGHVDVGGTGIKVERKSK